jgi:predicted CXXCH cytochrome family protein
MATLSYGSINWRNSGWKWLIMLAVALFVLCAAHAVSLAETNTDTEEECLDCHEEPDEELKLADGTSHSIAIDATKWSKSVHGKKLKCRECHSNIADHPHPKVEEKSITEYRSKRGDICRSCHYAYYTRVADGIHYRQLEKGDERAPTCTSCHGTHYTESPGKNRRRTNKRCAGCHEGVAKTYSESVHGKAIDGDLPLCTDCHGAHGIKDPRKASSRLAVHKVCERCHGDEKRMERHGLNPNVVKSYLDDFHGGTNAIHLKSGDAPTRTLATCVDCHGIHDIKSSKDEIAAGVLKGRLVKRCQSCHPKASATFADAWLSHYPPTWEKAPLVWGIQWTYRIFIPVVLVGLTLHILLHLWGQRPSRRKEKRSSEICTEQK